MTSAAVDVETFDVSPWLDAARHMVDRHQAIRGIEWPDGHRVAVNFTSDFDAMLLRRLQRETPMQLAKGEFGGRVGIWRLIELFDAHQIKATFFTPGRICELYPESLRAAAASGHELADHMWEHQIPATRALQIDHLRRTLDALERVSGTRPVGTRSDFDRDLMVAAGLIYNSWESASQGPYYHRHLKGPRWMLELPFHYALDDAQFYNFNWLGSTPHEQRISDPGRVFDLWWDAFQHAYRSGGYLNICVHPFLSRAMRIAMLDQLIGGMKQYPGVWFATCSQVARHCLAHHPRRPAAQAVPAR